MVQPDSDEAQDDRRTALHLVKRRKQLHLSGLSSTTYRYVVGDKSENFWNFIKKENRIIYLFLINNFVALTRASLLVYICQEH